MNKEEALSRVVSIFVPIARDLARGGLKVELRPERNATSQWLWLAALFVEDECLGTLEADPEASEESQVRRLAGQAQDLVLERLRRGGDAVVWPGCREGHSHPMEIDRTTTGWPFWVCPWDRQYRVPVGGA